jgi:hypothetical protein
LFFKYSLNNFLHAQVEECIRLVFAWNNNSLNQVETSKSPTSIRVRTPPTVEMVDSSCKDDADEESENNNAAEDDAVTNIDEKEILAGETTLKDPQQPDEDEAKADKPPTDEVVDPQYDNPILIDVILMEINIYSAIVSTLKSQYSCSFIPIIALLVEFSMHGKKMRLKR